MSDITKEQIQRLEKVGLAIVDSIYEDYKSLKNADDDKKQRMDRIFNEISGVLNKEAISNAK